MSAVMEAPRAVVPADRIFYTGMALLSALLVFIGFSPTFFQRGAELGPLAPVLNVHGIVFTSWIALFIAQTALIAANRRPWHRTLGAAGAALAVVMTVLGVMAAVDSLRRGAVPIPGIDPRSFFAIPMRDIVVFPLFVAAAVYWRRDAELHKRLMLLATITLLAAAIARCIMTTSLAKLGPPAFYGLQDLMIVAGMVYDRATRGRVHAAYWWGLGVTVGSQVLFLAISGTGPWLAFAELFLP
jgi:hypothetical protein